MNANEGAGGVWWLYHFLARTFFQACNVHSDGNHQNHYCIDCETAACQNCVEQDTHTNHRLIKIYRLVYKDVVSADQMSRHIDCSRIQPYSSNGRQVLALQPLPHNRSGELNQKAACRTCQRILMNPSYYYYCSIACKFHIGNGAGGAGANGGAPGGGAGGANGGAPGGGAGGRDRGRGRGGAAVGDPKAGLDSGTSRRKGVPRRSPLF